LKQIWIAPEVGADRAWEFIGERQVGASDPENSNGTTGAYAAVSGRSRSFQLSSYPPRPVPFSIIRTKANMRVNR
jgi:hypothetical protein